MSLQDNYDNVLEKETVITKPPAQYKVVLLNDDFTPMEFVVIVLMTYFGKCESEAMEITLSVHKQGKGICGIYPRDVAETRIVMVMDHAKKDGHPLQCTLEEV